MDAATAINAAAVMAELRQMRDEMRVEAALQRQLTERLLAAVTAAEAPAAKAKVPRPSGAKEADRPRAGALLAMIFNCIGDRTFTIAELTQVYAKRYPALAGALEQGGLSGKQLGKLFARFEADAVGGLTVEKLVKEHAGIVWKVVCDLESPEKVAKSKTF